MSIFFCCNLIYVQTYYNIYDYLVYINIYLVTKTHRCEADDNVGLKICRVWCIFIIENNICYACLSNGDLYACDIYQREPPSTLAVFDSPFIF